MKRTILILLGLPLFVAMLATQTNADIVFEIVNNDGFDGAIAGSTVMGTPDPATGANVTLTVVDVTAPEFDATFMTTGVTLSSLAGDDVNLNANASGDLGVDNGSITSGNFFGGAGTETADLNLGETFVVSFDQPITLDLIDFASLGGGDSLDIIVGGGGPTVNFVDGTASDIFIDPLGVGTVIPVGTTLTFVTGGTVDGNVRIADFEVSIAEVVPEPGSLAILGFGSVLMMARRRRR